MLTGKKILIGITGSIAAYKIPLLVRLLKKQGAEVQVVMTDAAKDFVTPLTLASDDRCGKRFRNTTHVSDAEWFTRFIEGLRP